MFSTALINYILFYAFITDHLTYCKEHNQDNSLNLNLKTVLELGKDNLADVEVIDSARSFLGKLKHAIEKGRSKQYFKSKHQVTEPAEYYKESRHKKDEFIKNHQLDEPHKPKPKRILEHAHKHTKNLINGTQNLDPYLQKIWDKIKRDPVIIKEAFLNTFNKLKNRIFEDSKKNLTYDDLKNILPNLNNDIKNLRGKKTTAVENEHNIMKSLISTGLHYIMNRYDVSNVIKGLDREVTEELKRISRFNADSKSGEDEINSETTEQVRAYNEKIGIDSNGEWDLNEIKNMDEAMKLLKLLFARIIEIFFENLQDDKTTYFSYEDNTRALYAGSKGKTKKPSVKKKKSRFVQVSNQRKNVKFREEESYEKNGDTQSSDEGLTIEFFNNTPRRDKNNTNKNINEVEKQSDDIRMKGNERFVNIKKRYFATPQDLSNDDEGRNRYDIQKCWSN